MDGEWGRSLVILINFPQAGQTTFIFPQAGQRKAGTCAQPLLLSDHNARVRRHRLRLFKIMPEILNGSLKSGTVDVKKKAGIFAFKGFFAAKMTTWQKKCRFFLWVKTPVLRAFVGLDGVI
ncbi:MAG: hypothetical protein FWC60_01230 [Firmicutes bacterium]|nr:hypothetical protein [Bacillota bacterium]